MCRGGGGWSYRDVRSVRSVEWAQEMGLRRGKARQDPKSRGREKRQKAARAKERKRKKRSVGEWVSGRPVCGSIRACA